LADPIGADRWKNKFDVLKTAGLIQRMLLLPTSIVNTKMYEQRPGRRRDLPTPYLA
jgi:hypothetical protein